MLPFLPVALLTVTRKRPASSSGPPPPSPGRNRFILHFLDLSKSTKFLVLIILQNLSRSLVRNFKTDVKHCWNFPFLFSAPLPAWRNVFSASEIFCAGRRKYHSNHRRACCTLLLYLTPRILLAYCNPGREKK